MEFLDIRSTTGIILQYITLLLIIILFPIKRLKIKKEHWLALAIILVIGLSLRISLTPYTDDFDSTGWVDIMAAKDLTNGLQGTTTDRSTGYPMIISFIFRIFGPSDTIIYILNIIIGTLDILLFFILLMTIFNHPPLAIFGSFLFATDPLIIQYSNTLAANSIYFMFIMLGLIAFFLSIKENNNKFAFLSILLLSFSHFIRAEFFPVTLILGLYLIFRKKIHFIKRVSTILLLLLLIIPSVFYLISIKDNVNNDSMIEDSGQVLTIERTINNLKFITVRYIQVILQNILFLPFFILGVSRAFKRKELLIIVSCLILNNIINVSTRIDIKYHALGYLPWVILFSVICYDGLMQAKKYIMKLNNPIARKIIISIIMAALVFSQLNIAIVNGSYYIEDGEVVAAIIEEMKQQPKDTVLIITGCNSDSLMRLYDKPYIQYSKINDSTIEDLLKNKKIRLITYQGHTPISGCIAGDFNDGKKLENFTLNLIESNIIQIYSVK